MYFCSIHNRLEEDTQFCPRCQDENKSTTIEEVPEDIPENDMSPLNPSALRDFLELRCYVCGEQIYDQILLWSLTKTTDRVFVAHERCEARMQDKPFTLLVGES